MKHKKMLLKSKQNEMANVSVIIKKQILTLFPTHINTKLKFIALCIYVKNDINFFEVGSRTIPFQEVN